MVVHLLEWANLPVLLVGSPHISASTNSKAAKGLLFLLFTSFSWVGTFVRSTSFGVQMRRFIN